MPEISWDLLLWGFVLNLAVIVGAILAAHLTHEFLIRRARVPDSQIPPIRFLASYLLLIFGYGILFSGTYFAYGAITIIPYTPSSVPLFLVLPLFVVVAFLAIGVLLLALGLRYIRRVLSGVSASTDGGSRA